MEPLSEPEKTIPVSIFGRIKKIVLKNLPLLIVVLLILLVMLPLSSKIKAKKIALEERQSQEKTTQKALTNVITMEIVPSLIQEKISLPGMAKPWVTLEVVSEVKGKITHKQVTEGQQVNKGDIIAIIDKSDYQNAYDGALASYDTAKTTHSRLKALVKKNFVTQSQLDDATAQLKTTKAAFDTANLNLSRCTILSPMKGIVDRIYIETGSFLDSGNPVVKIIQIDKLKIEVGIPESDVDAVRNLDTFEITIDALGQKKYTGHSHYLYKTADSLARLYTLEIRVDNPEFQILPDMFARVNIIKSQDPYGLAVPMYALVTLDKEVGVYVEKDGVVQFTPVVPGFLDGWKIQILTGLSPRDHVVVVGHKLVEDGEQVLVTKVITDMKELAQ
ncbi:MAG: efflux RND transporter periplasmic adaptor subunit [Pseudomonadota bacterium]